MTSPDLVPAPEVIAAVDIGSNSAHLLVALVDDRTVTPLADESALLGLGAIVDRDGRLPFAARRALLEALDGFVATARRWHTNELVLLGAEPFRRAADADEVSDMALGRVGVPIVVLEHAEEAELTLLGVTRGTPVEAPLLVVDIGGGSTEAIHQAPGRAPRTFVIATGSNRLTQACDPGDPPMPADREHLAMQARELLAAAPGRHPVRAVLVGGSATNLARVVTGVRGGDPGSPANVMSRVGVEQAIHEIDRTPSATLAERYRLTPIRARLLPAGAALVLAFMERYALDVVEVSEASLREGAVLALRHAGPDWRSRLTGLTAGWLDPGTLALPARLA
jgi:exopolyphosphatase/guanosine-5'-triphosphate,3'-diphosphate pyrophosphatase